MATTTYTIGQEIEIYEFSVKQKGYGRQGLYVVLYKKDSFHLPVSERFTMPIYIMDVFPNVAEHFDNYILREDAFFSEDEGYYTDGNGNGQYSENELFDSVLDMLNHALKGNEVEIDEDEVEQENEND